LLARSLRWSHQVPGCVDVPVAAFTPARGGGGACRVRPGSAGVLRVYSQRPADRVNASSVAESGKAICIIFVALVVGRAPAFPRDWPPSAKAAGRAGIPVAAFARKAVLDAAGS
jgi:hypothetical protein